MREGKDRGFGIPRTEEERAAQHAYLYPGEPLPPRGKGFNRISQGSSHSWIAPIIVFSGLMSLIVAAISRKKI